MQFESGLDAPKAQPWPEATVTPLHLENPREILTLPPLRRFRKTIKALPTRGEGV